MDNDDLVRKNREKMEQAKQMFHEETQKEKDFSEEEKSQETTENVKKNPLRIMLFRFFAVIVAIPLVILIGLFIFTLVHFLITNESKNTSMEILAFLISPIIILSIILIILIKRILELKKLK